MTSIFYQNKIMIFTIEEAEGFHQLFQREPLQQGIHGPLIAPPRSTMTSPVHESLISAKKKSRQTRPPFNRFPPTETGGRSWNTCKWNKGSLKKWTKVGCVFPSIFIGIGERVVSWFFNVSKENSKYAPIPCNNPTEKIAKLTNDVAVNKQNNRKDFHIKSNLEK